MYVVVCKYLRNPTITGVIPRAVIFVYQQKTNSSEQYGNHYLALH